MKYYIYNEETLNYKGFINSDTPPNSSTTTEPAIPGSGMVMKFIMDSWVESSIVVNLDKAKEDKIRKLAQTCEELIINGFESDALGTIHTYQSSRDDQNNLVALATIAEDDIFKCFDGTTWSYKLHTAAQLRTILINGKDIKMDLLTNFNTKKNSVLSAVSKEEIDTIVF